MILGVLCYIKRGGKTLFLHRIKKDQDEMKDLWIGLGGKVEKGEFPHESIVREVEEESGLKIVPTFRGNVAFLNEGNERNDWYAYLYTTSNYTGRLKKSNEGELVWVKNQDIKTLNLLEGDSILLNLLKEKKFILAKFLYKGEKLESYRLY